MTYSESNFVEVSKNFAADLDADLKIILLAHLRPL